MEEGNAARFAGDVPDHLLPEVVQAELIGTQRAARYWWAGAATAKQRVLDCGCGRADGSVILARAGAAEVVGVDPAGAVLESVRSSMPPKVALEQGDLAAMPFGAGAFEAVVCFDTLERVPNPDAVLDEIRRVLQPGGAVFVSAATADIKPDDLNALLSDRFANVAIYEQHLMTAAVVGDPARRLKTMDAASPSDAAFTVAVASDGDLPTPAPLSLFGPAVEVTRWLELWRQQQATIRSDRERIRQLETEVAQRAELRTQLFDAEQALASAFKDAESLREQLNATSDRLRAYEPVAEQARNLEVQINDMRSSTSWRLTFPVRRFSDLLRRLKG